MSSSGMPAEMSTTDEVLQGTSAVGTDHKKSFTRLSSREMPAEMSAMEDILQ